MIREIRLNTIILCVLIAIIILNFFLAENSSESSVFFIGGLSMVKFFSVTFQFMEVKTAHFFWKMLVLLFAAVYIIGIMALG